MHITPAKHSTTETSSYQAYNNSLQRTGNVWLLGQINSY